MPVKAYMVFNADDGPGECCFLTYAHTRNQARHLVASSGYGYGFDEYYDLSALRRPEMDQYAKGETPYIIETNDDLPEGVTFYVDEEEE